MKKCIVLSNPDVVEDGDFYWSESLSSWHPVSKSMIGRRALDFPFPFIRIPKESA